MVAETVDAVGASTQTWHLPPLTADEQAAWERAARTGDPFLARDVRLAYLRRVIGTVGPGEQAEQAEQAERAEWAA